MKTSRVLRSWSVVSALAGIFLLAWQGVSSASISRLKFRHLTTRDGLSHNSVYATLQDQQGFMWFGTYVGLNKYDGYTFTAYKHDPDDPTSLSNNVVLALWEDRKGTLWVGTGGGGLNRLDRKTNTFIRYQQDPEHPQQGLCNNHISAFAEDASGDLWMATDEELTRFDQETGRFTCYRNDPENPHSVSDNKPNKLAVDHLNQLWIGTQTGGLNRFDPDTEQFIRYQHDPANPFSLSDNRITSLYEDTNGTLWVGTMGGVLNRLDRTTGQFQHYTQATVQDFDASQDQIEEIAEDYAGRLWVGNGFQGVSRFDPATGQFTRYFYNPQDPQSLNDNRIRSFYRDRSGVLWIGTKTGGVNLFDYMSEQFPHYTNNPDDPNSLSFDVIYAMYEDRAGAIWIGTHGAGLNRWDRAAGQWTHYRHDPANPHSLSHDRIRAIYQDQQGIFWIGTYGGGLNRFDPASGEFQAYESVVDDPTRISDKVILTIYEDRAGRLWVGTETSGLVQLDRAIGRFTTYRNDPQNPQSVSHNCVPAIYEDQQGVFWVGTQEGLNQFDRATGQTVRYHTDPKNPHSLSDNAILCMYEDQAGRFWIGTRNGLNQMDRTAGLFTRYREKDGLPNETIYGILEDRQGNLWLSTNKGISKFNPTDKTFTNYDTRDGLQGDEFNSGAHLQTRDGLMLFGGFNGFNAFYPEDLHTNPYVPPVVVTDFQLFHQPVPIGDNSPLQQPIGDTTALTLSFKDFILSFEFAALNYTAPEKNRYRYKMEGFETNWNETQSHQRRAVYTNLPAGKFVFRVHGSNNDGVWNEAGASLALTVTPPYWQTWWFRGGFFALVLGMAAVAYRYRVSSLQRRKQELEQQVRERTLSLQNEIEERKRTEQALRDSEERFRSMVETAPSMLHITDHRQKNIYVSPNCEEMTGYTQAELLREFHWWAHEDDTVRTRELFDGTLRNGLGQRNFEYKAVKKNGAIWQASTSWEALKNDDGTIAGIVAQTIDITERKRAEQELQRLYEQANQDAEIKTRLLREVNHRVGNNLAAIAGMLSLERRHLKDRDREAYQNLMLDLSNRVNGLARVHQMLSSSQWQPLRLDELLRQVVHSSLQMLPLEKHIRVTIDPSTVRVTADQAHDLALVMNELTTNVIKYAVHDRDSAAITVQIIEEAEQIGLIFRDDGPGYPDDVLHHERYHVGLELIQQVVCRSLNGSVSLSNDHGALTRLTLARKDTSI